jgi:hypothetical protein
MLRRDPILALLLGTSFAPLLLSGLPARAQVQQFLLAPGSSVGSETQVKPKNCVTDPKTGAITCDTEIVNPPGNTPAKPSYTPFGN